MFLSEILKNVGNTYQSMMFLMGWILVIFHVWSWILGWFYRSSTTSLILNTSWHYCKNRWVGSMCVLCYSGHFSQLMQILNCWDTRHFARMQGLCFLKLKNRVIYVGSYYLGLIPLSIQMACFFAQCLTI